MSICPSLRSGHSSVIVIVRSGSDFEERIWPDEIAIAVADDLKPYEDASYLTDYKDPTKGYHNYLNLSGHYGQDKHRSKKSVGKAKRGYNNVKYRSRQTN